MCLRCSYQTTSVDRRLLMMRSPDHLLPIYTHKRTLPPPVIAVFLAIAIAWLQLAIIVAFII